MLPGTLEASCEASQLFVVAVVEEEELDQHLLRFPDRRRAVCSIVRFDALEQSSQLADHVRMLCINVLSLGQIVLEVVKLARMIVGCVAALLFEPFGLLAVVSARGVDEYPLSLPDGEITACAVMDSVVADRSILSTKERQHADAILAFLARQFDILQLCARRHEVAQNGQLIAGRIWWRYAGP